MITALLQQKKSEAQRHQVTAGKSDVELRCLLRYYCATSATWKVTIQETDPSFMEGIGLWEAIRPWQSSTLASLGMNWQGTPVHKFRATQATVGISTFRALVTSSLFTLPWMTRQSQMEGLMICWKSCPQSP